MHHAIVGVPCVNVVIVVLGELHVVRVVPLVVRDDAVVRRTLVLIAFTVSIVFIVAILRRILLYWRYSVYIVEVVDHVGLINCRRMVYRHGATLLVVRRRCDQVPRRS